MPALSVAKVSKSRNDSRKVILIKVLFRNSYVIQTTERRKNLILGVGLVLDTPSQFNNLTIQHLTPTANIH